MHRPSANEIRLYIALFGIVASCIAGGLLYYRHVESVVRQAAVHEIEAIADIKASQVARWRQKRLDVAKLLQSAPHTLDPLLAVLQKRNVESNEPIAQSFIDSLREREQLRRVLLLDEHLRPVMSSPKKDFAWDASFNASAALCLEESKVMMSDIHHREVDNRPAMGIFIPLLRNSPFGAHQGVLLMEFDPHAYMFPYVQEWPTPSPTAETFLFRKEGDYVVAVSNLRHIPNSSLRFKKKISEIPNVAAVRALSGSTEVKESFDYRDVRVIAATRSIPDSNWFLVSKRDLAEINVPIQRIGVMVTLIVVGLVICGALAVGFIWRTQDRDHTLRELREREEASEALRRSDQRYRRLFSEMNLGFSLHEIICDEKGAPVDFIFLETNPAFERLTGLPASEVIGHRASEVMPDLDSDWIQKYGRVAITGEPCTFEKYKSSLGRYFEIRSYSPEPGKFAILFQDTTERVQAEAERQQLHTELLRKNEEMESLIYAASHDLRSPLVNIEGFSHKLERLCGQITAALNRTDVPADLQQSLTDIANNQLNSALQFIRGGVKKMNALIAGLLHVSRFGKMEIQPCLLDTNAILREIVTSHAFQLQKAGAELKLGTLPTCWADPTLFNQVFSNLLDNAVKYRNPNRTLVISITGHSKNASSVYCVEDNGIGIKPEHLDKVWELFRRLEPDGPTPGEGIGLSLVRRIVSRLHGRSWVESTPGEGSRFFIEFPQKPHPAPKTTTEP